MPIFDIWNLVSGILGGASNVYSNMLNTTSMFELEDKAEEIGRMSQPLLESMVESYKVGGEGRQAMTNQGLLGAASDYSKAKTDVGSQAWRFGGAGAGRTGGLLRDVSRGFDLTSQQSALQAGNKADQMLADLQVAQLGATKTPDIATPFYDANTASGVTNFLTGSG